MYEINCLFCRLDCNHYPVMAQEYHVLRCFSCQIFQVLLVKKSKKWECKVCGEKQSVIQFGRGAAADCRRHVQKLNYLGGDLLEENTETVLSHWEQDNVFQNECLNEDLNSNKSEVVATVSCWSKYVNQTTEGPKQEEEKEEENIDTKRDQFRTQGTRKRQLVSELKFDGDHYGNFKDKEARTGNRCFKRWPYQELQLHEKLSSSWNKGCFSKYSHHNSPKNVSWTRTHLPSSPQAVSSYHTASTSYSHTVANCNKGQYNSCHNHPRVKVSKHLLQPNKDPSTPLSSCKFSESKLENNASKWNKFLTVVSTQEEDNVNDHLAPSALIDNTVVSESTEALTDSNSEEYRCPLAGKTDTGVPGKQKPVGDICGDGNSSYQSNSHMLTSEPTSSENPLCNQPSLTKMLFPGLFLNPLFSTEEDFDDTF
ncbi:MRN complex-interacting protein isoform X2 [Triplophysa dalaica]|uniref:MRN complex-interacting protein isoform X2 n=1 Tax=Triplophysa dalaica TaxID=1582913 RepID=UPI0024DF6FA8|nr:MRN complex-interacting protein isoform X2 [Triplophysa dalaica]